jgi:hypothetical protein
MARTATVAPPAPPAPPPADLVQALRWLKLGTVRRLAPASDVAAVAGLKART